MYTQDTIKPKNHIAIHAKNRKAGFHGKTEKAKRSKEKIDLKKELI